MCKRMTSESFTTSLRGEQLAMNLWSPLTLATKTLACVANGSALTSTPATSNYPSPALGRASKA
eukprot:2424287-Prorocentrum_lima.AAC.1